jgi:UDP-N-acetylglucosamine 2-epimerase (non-hydrolysing)
MTKSKKASVHIAKKQEVKILSVVGARPNFMKAAPIIRAIEAHNGAGKLPRVRHVLVHTGQHYGELMSDQFFHDLNLPKPDIQLGVGSATQATQTAQILMAFEKTIEQEWPDIIVVVGDVNSTVACALAAAKLPIPAGRWRPLVAHVEAGLRSFDRDMPEEINRIVTDHLADLLFVTEKSGLANLRREGISASKVFFVGNTMIDSLFMFKGQTDRSTVLEQLGLRASADETGKASAVRPYALLTLHRPSNVDHEPAFKTILDGLSKSSLEFPIIFPVHPRTRNRISEFGLNKYFAQNSDYAQAGGIVLTDPLGYVDFQCLMRNARMVLTDSGGIQEESTCLGIPCATIRENTERPVTVTHGTNMIAGTTAEGIRKAIIRQTSKKRRRPVPEKWDGHAAERLLPILIHKAQSGGS